MDKFKKKTFANSYLFNFDQGTYNKIHKDLADFIIKSKRIDKNSEAFKGIVEETKRFQNTSVLYSVLLSNNVIFCINSKELSAPFKVFEANNVRDNDGYKIFIDCTGLIKEVNGYYVCRKIDVFFTYLYEAMNLLLYSTDPVRYLSNSQVTMAAAEAYVALFNYVIDYKRIIGYAQNKQKISYLIALFFIHNMMGKEIDTYAKNVACKIARLSANETRAFELYYADDSFDNIDKFIKMLANTFKLKGLTTEVFVGQWIYSFGKGTEYAVELFTSFTNMLVATYCGAYVVHQKTIEKCCGSSMISFVNAFTKVALPLLDKRALSMEASEIERTIHVDPSVRALQEKLLMKEKKPNDAVIDKYTIRNKANTKKAVDSLIKYYKKCGKTDKIGKELLSAARKAYGALKRKVLSKAAIDSDDYDFGCLEIILTAMKGYSSNINTIGIRKAIYELDDILDLIIKNTAKPTTSKDKLINKNYLDAKKELSKCKTLL